MTTGDEAKARELLANAKALLLDFDGPICSVFAGLSAPVVAEQLRVVLADGGRTDLPESVATTGDPFDVFRYAATLGDEEARYVEAAFTALEVEAIATAEPTPGAHELMQAWHDSGRPLAIVSNNSAVAINVYVDLYGLGGLFNLVSARVGSKLEQLKPEPYLLYRASRALRLPTTLCVFVGDSITDIEAAFAAEMPVIGYVNKASKCMQMGASTAGAVVNKLSRYLAEKNIR